MTIIDFAVRSGFVVTRINPSRSYSKMDGFWGSGHDIWVRELQTG
jgi:hypothetical protein